MPSELDLMRAGQLYNSTAAELVNMRATAKQKFIATIKRPRKLIRYERKSCRN